MLKYVGRPIPPHPGPLPEEREEHRPTLEHCQEIRFADRLATILPLPACRAVASSRRLGKRAGVRGNGLRMVQPAPVREMRARGSALAAFAFYRSFVDVMPLLLQLRFSLCG